MTRPDYAGEPEPTAERIRALLDPLTDEQQAFRDSRPNVLGSLEDTQALNRAGL